MVLKNLLQLDNCSVRIDQLRFHLGVTSIDVGSSEEAVMETVGVTAQVVKNQSQGFIDFFLELQI